jgi:transposase
VTQPPQADDPKGEALRKHRALNPRPEEVREEGFRTEGFFDPRDLVQVKYEMLRRAQDKGITVTEVATTFGFSRPTFYEARRGLEGEGMVGLVPKPPGPKGAHKLTEEVMAFAEGLLEASPGLGAKALAGHIEERFGRSVHPRSIERALERREKKRRGTG